MKGENAFGLPSNETAQSCLKHTIMMNRFCKNKSRASVDYSVYIHCNNSIMRLNKTHSISKTIPSMSVCKTEANDREGKISLNQSFVHGKAYSLFYRMFNLKLVWPRSKIFHSSWAKLRTSAFWKSIKRCLLKVVLDGGIRIQNRGALFDTWALILLIFDDQVFMQIANKCQEHRLLLFPLFSICEWRMAFLGKMKAVSTRGFYLSLLGTTKSSMKLRVPRGVHETRCSLLGRFLHLCFICSVGDFQPTGLLPISLARKCNQFWTVTTIKLIINDWNNSAVLKIFRYVLNIPK